MVASLLERWRETDKQTGEFSHNLRMSIGEEPYL